MLNRLWNKCKAGLLRSLSIRKKTNAPDAYALIEQEIYGTKLFVPSLHQLPRILKKHPLYSSNLARISAYIVQKYDQLKIIDIGANIGDSLPLFRQHTQAPVLCIEGDDFFFEVLTKNARLFPDVSLLKTLVGEKQQQQSLTIKQRGGTAHLAVDTAQETLFHINTLSGILFEEYQNFLDAKLLKIDTDGYDGKILRGGKEFLLHAKPVVFFEYDPWCLEQQQEDGLSIFTFLHSLNYYAAIIYTNVGEYLLSTELDNLHLLQELHLYYSGRKSEIYCDICVFHVEDQDLFKATVNQEIDFFKHLKSHPATEEFSQNVVTS